MTTTMAAKTENFLKSEEKGTLDYYRAMRRVMKSAEDACESKGLSLPAVMALGELVTGPMEMSKFSRALGVTMGAGTNLADRLVDRGQIRRFRPDGDRRVVKVELTDSGRALFAEAVVALRAK